MNLSSRTEWTISFCNALRGSLAKNMKAEAIELMNYLSNHDFKISPREAEYPGAGTFVPRDRHHKDPTGKHYGPGKQRETRRTALSRGRSDTFRHGMSIAQRNLNVVFRSACQREPQSFQFMIPPAERTFVCPFCRRSSE